jgi:hypothetical protein
VAAIPLAFALASILNVVHTNQNPWARAGLQEYPKFYLNWFDKSIIFAVAAMVLLAARELFWKSEEREPESATPIPEHEMVLAVLFLALPLVAITVAVIVPPHFFTERYAASATAGFALLLAFLASRLSGGKKTVGVCLTLAALAPFLRIMNPVLRLANPLDDVPLLVRALQHETVVVDNPLLFLQLWYYAPSNLKGRLLYLSDAESAVKYNHTDEAMDVFGPLDAPVTPYNTFATPGREFVLFTGRKFGWLPKRLAEDLDQVAEVGRDGNDVLLKVKIAAKATGPHSPPALTP